MATTMVETLIKMADCGRTQDHSGPGQGTGGQRYRHHVVPGGPDQVLQHLPIAGRREAPDGDDSPRVVRGEHDPGRLDGDVGARSDGDADICLGQGRGVVDPVSDHCHRQTRS